MELKEALSEAVRYVSEIESLTGGGETPASFRANGCVAIEEVRYDETVHAWYVSVGFFRPWNRKGRDDQLLLHARAAGLRTVKTVVVDDASGEVIDYRSFVLAPVRGGPSLIQIPLRTRLRTIGQRSLRCQVALVLTSRRRRSPAYDAGRKGEGIVNADELHVDGWRDKAIVAR